MTWRARSRDPVVLGLVAVALAGTGFAAWSHRGDRSEPAPVVRFAIPTPPQASANSLGLSTLAISRDGRMLVYIGESDGRRPVLMVRALDDLTPRALAGTEDGSNPVFSPDGKWIAFVRGNQLFKTAVDGDRPQMLTRLPGTFGGMSWSSTGVIVLSGTTAMYAVSDAGGKPRQLGKPSSAFTELDQESPVVVDEEGFYLYASTTNSSLNTARMAIATLETGEQTVFDVLGSQPLGIVDGVLLYVTGGGEIMGVPIDVRGRKLAGKPVQLLSNVANNPTTGLARASLSRDGTLFYQTGTQASQVIVAGLDGSARTLLAEPHEYAFPRLSPDGRRLAVTIGATDRRDIWLYDVSSQTGTPLTSESSTNDRPEWTPDGKRLLYHTDRHQRSAIWWRAADLSAGATSLIEGERIDVFEAVMTPDMRAIVYQLDTLGADLYYRAVSGDTTPRAISNDVRAIETMPRLSPNGRWVAFATDESGRNEVVVQPFPGPGGRVQLSSGGGTEPIWSRDGRRLFYRSGGRLMAATLDTADGVHVVSRDSLFADVYQYAPNPHANYDVMPDGTHFLFLKAVSEGNMIVATNWGRTVGSRISGVAAK